MPNATPTRHGNLNVQTEVVSRSKRSTFIVTDEPDGQNQAITREEGAQVGRGAGRLHRRAGHGRDRRLHRERPGVPHARAPLHRGGEREHRRDAAAALLHARRRRARAGADRHLHAEPQGRGLSRRPPDRGRPRAGRHARLQLGLLRRVEEGRAAHVEQARLRPRRAPAARGLQDHPDARRPQGRADRRPLRHGQDDDDLHAPERLAARSRTTSSAGCPTGGSWPPRTAASRRPSGSTPTTSRRSTARSRSRTRTSRTSPSTATRSTSTTRATRRTAARRSRSASSSQASTRRSTRRTSC